jgi:ubiquinone/menaquinone biosynthesis C-methylase UbiE
MILDIGCGEAKRGSIGIDFRKTKSVDVIADARFLPFKNESFNYVFSSAVIEHFSHRTVKNVLSEWTRVLTHNGVIEIKCPDLRARAFIFFLIPPGKISKTFTVDKNMMEIIINADFLMVFSRICWKAVGFKT